MSSVTKKKTENRYRTEAELTISSMKEATRFIVHHLIRELVLRRCSINTWLNESMSRRMRRTNDYRQKDWVSEVPVSRGHPVEEAQWSFAGQFVEGIPSCKG